MITATSKDANYITEVTDGTHFFFADSTPADGGSGLYQRPGDILASSLAACVNITARMLLEQQGFAYDRVVVQVELDRADPDHPAFRAHVDIQGNLPQSDKDAIIGRLKNCPVCKLLRAPADVAVD